MKCKKLKIQKIAAGDIITVFLAVFFISKMIRAFSGSQIAGGIWNYIQIGIVLCGLLLLCCDFGKYTSETAVLLLVFYTAFSMINSIFHLEFNREDLFDYVMIAYPLCIFITAFFIAGHKAIEKQAILNLAFYLISSVFIFSMLRADNYSTTIGATADVYFILGLLPLVLIGAKIKLLPCLFCGLAVLLSGKRLGIIAFVLMVGAYYIGIAIQQNKVKKILPLLFITYVVGGMAVYIGANYNNFLWHRLEALIYSQDSSGRNYLWARIIELLENSNIVSLVFGHGDGAVSKTIGAHAHNDYLEILYDFGILPLILYASFYVRCIVVFWGMLKRKYQHAICFGMSLLFSLFVSMFSFYCIAPTYITCGMLCAGYILHDYRSKCFPNASITKTKRIRFGFHLG